MLVADLAQPLEIADRRRIDPDRARDRLDDHGRNRRGVVQRTQPLEVLGQLFAELGLAAGEGVALEVERVPHVVDARQHRPEGPPVRDHAADRHAAEADPVIGALAADQPGALPLAARPMVGERDLECGIAGWPS